MAKENNVKNEADVVEIKTPEGNDVSVVEKEGLLKKAGRFIKKHGKKIAIGAAGVGVAVVGYALGNKHGSKNSGIDMIDGDPEGDEFEVFDADEVDSEA